MTEHEALSSLLLTAATRAAARCFARAHEIGREIAGGAGTGIVLLTQSEAAELVQALEALAETGHALDDEQHVLLVELRDLAFSAC